MNAELSDAMGHMLPTGAPPGLVDAVRRAGSILAPAWSGLDGDLRTVALALYALGHERSVPVDQVPLAAVRAALDSTSGALRERLVRALRALGHITEPGPDAPWPVVRDHLLAGARDADWLGTLARELWSERPDALDLALLRLRPYLDTLIPTQAAALPPAPPAEGVLEAGVDGEVVAVYPGGEAAAVRCTVCGESTSGTVRIDGPVGAYTCRHGHTTPLPAGHVRALRTVLAEILPGPAS